MKRTLALILSLVFLFSCLTACSSEIAEETLPKTAADETAGEEEESSRFLDLYPTDPQKLSSKMLSSLPIASEEMTPAQLRQLAVDYMEYQLSFTWKNNIQIDDWPTTYSKSKKTLDTSYLYSGIPYQSQGAGNLYRWLEYYNEETGEMDLARALAENGGYGDGAAITTVQTDENGNITYKRYRSFMTMFNQCSLATSWSWTRVVNSANLGGTADMNVYNGLIPVGCYTYPNMQKIDKFGETTDGNPTAFDTKDVIAHVNQENGVNGMKACYAQLKPGDCLVSPGHAMMVKSVSVVKNKDGSVNYAKSSITILDQGEGWSIDGQLGDTPWRRQGNVDEVHPFSYYEKAGYLPFTFREFQDPEDPVDQKHIQFYDTYIKNNFASLAARYDAFNFSSEEMREMSGEGVEKAYTFTTALPKSMEISLEQLSSLVVASNYPISDMFVTVLDKDGKEVFENVYRTLTVRTRQVKMTVTESSWETKEDGSYKTIFDGLEEYAGKGNSVKITLQLSTGEKLTALERGFTA